jgi:hypothetical protein
MSLNRRLTAATCASALACLVLGVLAGPASAAAKSGTAGPPDPGALVEKRTGDLSKILAQARKRLRKLAHLPSVLSGNASACSADMAALPPLARYGSSGAADLQGNLFCLGIPITSPVNIADRAYFLRAIGTRDLGVGDYQLGRVTGLGSIGLGFPTIVNRRVTGIVLTVLSLDWLEKRIIQKRPRGALDVLVIDDHGTVLARAGVRPTRPGTNIGGSALVRAMLSRDQGEGTFRLGHRKVRAAFDAVPLSAENMRVAVSVAR